VCDPPPPPPPTPPPPPPPPPSPLPLCVTHTYIQVETLRQTCEQLKSDKTLLVACRWTQEREGARGTQVHPSEETGQDGEDEKDQSPTALSLAVALKEGMARYRAACARVDVVVAEAQVLFLSR